MMIVSDIYEYLANSSYSFPEHPMIATNDKVGLEIELEGVRRVYREPPNDSWEVVSDGSLRDNGVEYITRGDGIGGVVLYEAIVALDDMMRNIHPSLSWRCSTHVHVDVRDLTAQQIKHMILIYIVFERFLFKCSGWSRYKNNFCIALGVGQGLIEILINTWNFSSIAFLNNVTASWNKYSAMNLSSVSRLGTIEFRISEAKWRSGQLIKLVNRFLSIKKLARDWEGSETDLIVHCLDNKNIFIKGLPRDVVIEPSDLELGAKLAFDILNKNKITLRNRRHIDNVINNTTIRIIPEELFERIDYETLEDNDLPVELCSEECSIQFLDFTDAIVLGNILGSTSFIHHESIDDYEYCRSVSSNNSGFEF